MRHTELTGVVREGAAFRAQTTAGEIHARRIVSCGGIDAGRVTGMLGVELPVGGEAIQASVTEPVAPLVRHLLYFAGDKLTLKQAKVGSLLVGGGWPARVVSGRATVVAAVLAREPARGAVGRSGDRPRAPAAHLGGLRQRHARLAADHRGGRARAGARTSAPSRTWASPPRRCSAKSSASSRSAATPGATYRRSRSIASSVPLRADIDPPSRPRSSVIVCGLCQRRARGCVRFVNPESTKRTHPQQRANSTVRCCSRRARSDGDPRAISHCLRGPYLAGLPAPRREVQQPAHPAARAAQQIDPTTPLPRPRCLLFRARPDRAPPDTRAPAERPACRARELADRNADNRCHNHHFPLPPSYASGHW